MRIQIDENLARAWLWRVQLYDFGREGAGLVVNDGLVFLGDLWSSHDVELKLTGGVVFGKSGG